MLEVEPHGGEFIAKPVVRAHRLFIAGLHFKMKGFDPERGRLAQREVNKRASHTQAACGRHDVQIIDEAVPAAIFNAVTESDDDVADVLPVASRDPCACQRLAMSDLGDGLFSRGIKRVTILSVEGAGQSQQRIGIIRTGGVEADIWRLHGYPIRRWTPSDMTVDGTAAAESIPGRAVWCRAAGSGVRASSRRIDPPID
jgi:hypothetical protein